MSRAASSPSRTGKVTSSGTVGGAESNTAEDTGDKIPAAIFCSQLKGMVKGMIASELLELAATYAEWSRQLNGSIRTDLGVPPAPGTDQAGKAGWEKSYDQKPSRIYDEELAKIAAGRTVGQKLNLAIDYASWASQLIGTVCAMDRKEAGLGPVRTVLVGRRLKLPSTATLAN